MNNSHLCTIVNNDKGRTSCTLKNVIPTLTLHITDNTTAQHDTQHNELHNRQRIGSRPRYLEPKGVGYG